MDRPEPQDGFTGDEEMAYLDSPHEFIEEEYDDFEDDGQPSEYDEWQDYYGGDDWDFGQYDPVDDY